MLRGSSALGTPLPPSAVHRRARTSHRLVEQERKYWLAISASKIGIETIDTLLSLRKKFEFTGPVELTSTRDQRKVGGRLRRALLAPRQVRLYRRQRTLTTANYRWSQQG